MQTAPADEGDGAAAPSLTHALNKDCLQELFARCTTPDLLSLGQTCRSAAALLAEADRPWAARLAADFGLRVDALPGSAAPLRALARQVYAAPRRHVRFQASLISGGVDDDNINYWADNIFLPPPPPASASAGRYYCSNCTANADCVGLLLDGEVPREERYQQALTYVRRRCRYAAAVLFNVHNANEEAMADADVLGLVDRWSDARVDHMFQLLAAQLQQDQPMGRLLLYDIPHDRMAEEEARVAAVHQYLRDRLAAMRAGMLKQDDNIWFDGSMLPKVNDPGRRRLVAVLRDVAVSRAGSLTCPVSAGAVVAGVIDFARLEGRPAAEAAQMLHAASVHPACASLNSLETAAAVHEAVASGELPPVLATGTSTAGQWIEFDAPKAARADGAGGSEPPSDLIAWAPLFWFRFHTREEAAALATPATTVAESSGSELEAAAPAAGGNGAAPAPAAVPGAASIHADGSESELASTASMNSAGSEGMDSDGEGPAGGGGQWDEEGLAGLGQGAAMEFPGDESDEDDGEEELAGRTAGCTLLEVALSRPRAANVLCVKLINQQNHMEEHDPHGWPNLDINYVSAGGKVIELPPGIRLVCDPSVGI